MRAIPGNRIVATLGPYKCYVAIPFTPFTHTYEFKARMRLQSCGTGKASCDILYFETIEVHLLQPNTLR